MTFWSALFSVSLSVLEDLHFLLGNDTHPAGCCLSSGSYFLFTFPSRRRDPSSTSAVGHTAASLSSPDGGGIEAESSRRRRCAAPAQLSASLDCIFQMCISDIKAKHRWWAAGKSERWGNRRMEDFSTTASGTIRAFWRVCDHLLWHSKS